MDANGQLQVLTDVASGERTSDIYLRGGWLGPRFGLGVLEKRKVSCLRRKLNYDSPGVHPAPAHTEQFVTLKGFGLLLAASLRPREKSHRC